MENQHQILTSFQHNLLLKSLDDPDLRPEYRRRIEIMLLADAGQSQAQICSALGCSHKTARYWMAMARVGEAHNYYQMGRTKTVNQQYRSRLQELVSHSPRDYGYPFERWTAQWLGKHLAQELEIKVSDRHINRLLKEMGLSTRPRCETVTTERSRGEDADITICDLQPAASPSFSLLFNPIKASS